MAYLSGERVSVALSHERTQRRRSGTASGSTWLAPELVWLSLLFVAVCFEGLARRFLPLPGSVLYFLKDVILLSGVAIVGLRPSVIRVARHLTGPLLPATLALTGAWCVASLLSPDHPSLILGLVGLRAYLLWWVAPLLVAGALQHTAMEERYQRIVVILSLAIAALAVYQFFSPADSAVNTYAWNVDEGSSSVAVSPTGNVRVISTFSYLSGFTGFVALGIPPLLAVGLTPPGSWLALLAAASLAVTAPMSGARGVVVLGTAGALTVLVLSRPLRSRRGWLALGTMAAFVVIGLWLTPEAAEGVSERFAGEDTAERIGHMMYAVPVYTIVNTRYPFLGTGVGMLQNAAAALQIDTGWEEELEPRRVIIELGLPGYLLVWTCRFLLAVALVKAARRLRHAGQGPWAGVACVYAAYVMILPLSTDHVSQSLLFVGIGVVLARLSAERQTYPDRR